MKKFILSLLFVFLGVNLILAQPSIQWQVLRGGSEGDRAFEALQTNDGGFITCGHTMSSDGDIPSNHGWHDYMIVKLDSVGNVQWQTIVGGSETDHMFSIIQTNDGGYIGLGYTQSSDGDVVGNHGDQDMWVIKLDASGNVQWSRCVGGTEFETGREIIQTIDSCYVIIGNTASFDGDVTDTIHGSTDVWVIKLNATGTIIWDRTFGGSLGDAGISIDQTTDSGYIFSSLTSSSDGDITHHFGTLSNYDYWVVKLDSVGNLQWQRTYGGSRDDYPGEIQQTFDGGFIVTGTSISNDFDVVGNHSFNDDCWILKLDSIGGVVWKTAYGGDREDHSYHIQQTLDSGFVFSASTDSKNGDVTGYHQGPFDNEDDAWIVKLSNSGVIQWQRTLGGSSSEQAWSIRQISNDEYIFAGCSSSNDGDITGPNQGFSDYWIVKLGPANPVSVEYLQFNSQPGFFIYPNPVTNHVIKINMDKNYNGDVILDIYSVSGQRVFENYFLKTAGEFTIDVLLPESFASGFYSIILRTKDKVLAGKLIIN